MIPDIQVQSNFFNCDFCSGKIIIDKQCQILIYPDGNAGLGISNKVNLDLECLDVLLEPVNIQNNTNCCFCNRDLWYGNWNRLKVEITRFENVIVRICSDCWSKEGLII